MIEYGLLGAKLDHSYSGPIHAMLADYRYELLPVTPDEFREVLRSRAFRGLNVTIPYKRDALPYLDWMSDEVREIGSANTLVMGDDGILRGYNTDLYGFMSMADRAGISLAGKKAVVLGSGGTSRTAQAAARRLGAAEIVVISRGGPVDYAALYRDHADAQVIVNATPVGMYPENGFSPVLLDAFPRCEGVLDVIYNPLRTALLLDAEEKGIPAANGLWMLVAQARRAAELFTGKPIDGARVAEICGKIRAGAANIALIGMPGSGKTTLGRALAKRLDRPFVDMDEMIVRRAGKSIPDIFRDLGENGFRRLETEIARECGKEKGQVIAAGGGAVTRPETMRALRQNGDIACVDRPLELLETVGRPLSVGGSDALRAMYAARLPLYRKYADFTVSNAGSVEAAVEALLRR